MHLEQGQSLDECIDCFGRKLLPLTEHYVHALEESEKVFLLKNQMSLLFEEPLCDGIESINEVFLINVESSACTDFKYLEGTEKSRENVRNRLRGPR